MNRNIKAFASALAMSLAMSLAAGSLAEAATVYVPEGSSGEVAIIDTTKDAIIGRIAGVANVHGFGGSPAARYLVAGSYDEMPPGGASVAKPEGVSEDEHAAHHGAGGRPAAGAVSILTILDAADGSPVRRLEVPGAVHHVAVSPDGRFAVATHPNADGISVTDLSELSVGELIGTGAMPNYAVFSADGSRLYVSNAGNGTVSEIDTGRWLVNRGYLPRIIAEGTMPSSTSAMAIAPVGIVNAGHPRAAAAQAMEIASLIHVTNAGFCQDAAAAVAAAVAAALSPGASVESVLDAALDNVRPWSGREMQTLMSDGLALARRSQDFKAFRAAYMQDFRRAIACDSRETVPAALAIVWLANGDPWQAAILGSNFGRDTDTIACMAAGICGALSGMEPAHEDKLDLLPPESLARQRQLARQLVEIRHAKAESERRALSNSL